MEQLSEMLCLDFFFLSKFLCLDWVHDDQDNDTNVCEELKKLTKIPIQPKCKIFMEENSLSVTAHTAGLHLSQNTPTTNCIFVQWRHLMAASTASSERKIGYSGKLFSCWDLITTLSHSIFIISLRYKWDIFDLQMVI